MFVTFLGKQTLVIGHVFKPKRAAQAAFPTAGGGGMCYLKIDLHLIRDEDLT